MSRARARAVDRARTTLAKMRRDHGPADADSAATQPDDKDKKRARQRPRRDRPDG